MREGRWLGKCPLLPLVVATCLVGAGAGAAEAQPIADAAGHLPGRGEGCPEADRGLHPHHRGQGAGRGPARRGADPARRAATSCAASGKPPSSDYSEAIKLEATNALPTSTAATSYDQLGQLRPGHRRLHGGHQARSERPRLLQQPRPDLRQPWASTTARSPTTRKRSGSTSSQRPAALQSRSVLCQQGRLQAGHRRLRRSHQARARRCRSLRGARGGARGARRSGCRAARTIARHWRSTPDNEDALEGLNRLGGTERGARSAPEKTTAGAQAPAAQRLMGSEPLPRDRLTSSSWRPRTCPSSRYLPTPQRPGPLLLLFAFLPFLAFALPFFLAAFFAFTV